MGKNMKKILLLTTLLLIVGCKEEVKKETNTTKIIKEHDKNITKKISKKSYKKYTKEQLVLKKELEIYLEQLKTLNTEGIIDMTYPKLFIPINKNMFKRYINTLLTSPHIAIESFDTNIIYIGEIRKFSDGEFAMVKYRSSIKLAFINPNLYNDELSIRVLNDVLSSKYGKENIIIDPKNRDITINKDEKLLSINEKNSGWKFIGDNKEYRRLYSQIIPLDILSQI